MEIEYESRFVAEAVLSAAARRPEGRLYWRERERVYQVGDPEERARAFDAVDLVWFVRLGLGSPIDAALAEQPLVGDGVGRCAIGRPLGGEAGAELFARAPEAGEPAVAARLLRILLRPALLLGPAEATAFLRRELQHVADMLDPAFGYEPRLPGVGGPGYQRLLRHGYRAVWNATVDGRLVRRGWLPPAVRAERRAEFARAFPALDSNREAAFDHFFNHPAPTHAAMMAFVVAASTAGRAAPRVCALCGCPTVDAEPDCEALGPVVLARIAEDFPGWRPADGCCRQCADLYRALPLSLAEAAALPGVR